MNSPGRVIGFVNAAHFIDHYSMLIFAAAVIVMGPALGMAYSELLPYATPGFVAFGAGSLLTGWLGDRWSRRHMMVIFFVGIGASMIAVGLVNTKLELGAALLSIGLFASIYHPVGTAMIVSYADRLGREMGINGVWGNLGVASSALVTGVIGQYLGWRWAFIVPGVATILLGLVFMWAVAHEDRSGAKQAAAQARVAKRDMWRVILALLIVVIAISTTFNAVTVALPKLFAERLSGLTQSPALLGLIAAGVYVFGAMTQYTIGKLLDRHSLKAVSLPLSFVLAPFLYLAAELSNLPLIIAAIGIVMGAFGQVTVNDAMVGKYTSEEWRSRAYAVRYFVGFTAAGASVGLVAWLYQQGGFATMLHAFAGLCLLVIAAAIILPAEIKVGAARAG
ncbi:MAG TPA: MFS transporter [Bradyrhizobium sp.]|jgi:MFS family permease|nr:MFS transporter [Bradyrhizobium sp.]